MSHSMSYFVLKGFLRIFRRKTIKTENQFFSDIDKITDNESQKFLFEEKVAKRLWNGKNSHNKSHQLNKYHSFL